MGRKSNRQKIIEILEKNGYELNKNYYLDNRTDDEDFRMPIWKHKDTNEYIASDFDLEKAMNFLLKYKIDSELRHGTGFSSETQTWYGWSHRAIGGFKIGDKIEKGSICYIPESKEEFIEECIKWHSDLDIDECPKTSAKEHVKIGQDGKEIKGVLVEYYRMNIDGMCAKFEDFEAFPNEWEGEREIKTLDEAKEMAFRFNREVS